MTRQSGVYRGVSAAERASQRRTRLLEATLAVWGEPGTKVTMTRICAEAGLTERYFYACFAGLHEALTAVMEQVAVEIEQRSQAAADAAGPDPAARVRASVGAFVDLVAEDPRKGRVTIVEAGAMPELRPRRTELVRGFARRSAEEARELYGPGRWGARDGELAGLLFVGGVAELVTAWLEGAVDAGPDEITDALTGLFTGMHR